MRGHPSQGGVAGHGQWVLIDTSIWVEALRPGGLAGCREAVARLATAGRAATCDVVLTEVLRGARSESQAEAWADSLLSLRVLRSDGVGLIAARIGRAIVTRALLLLWATFWSPRLRSNTVLSCSIATGTCIRSRL